MPEIGEVLYVTDRKRWRQWLLKHHNTKKEIWLRYPHKVTGKPRIVYNDAVEEALCFGWIDSTVKNHGDASVQRFTPRRKGSGYSQQNRERLMWLLKHKQIAPSIIDEARRVTKDVYVPAPDIIKALKSNEEAWKHWQTFSPSYQRIRAGYVDENRGDPEQFKKSLDNLVKKTAVGKQFGYGGLEKYF